MGLDRHQIIDMLKKGQTPTGNKFIEFLMSKFVKSEDEKREIIKSKVEILEQKLTTGFDIVILGTGLAGLIYAWKNRTKKILLIGSELGGQMASTVSLGPRIIQKDANTEKLLIELGYENVAVKTAKILYYHNSQIYEEAPENFANEYSEYTRGSSVADEHTMSQGKSSIEYFDVSFNDLVLKIYNNLLARENITIINDTVVGIFDKVVITKYMKLDLKGAKKVSTIPLTAFKLASQDINRNDYPTPSTTVNFYSLESKFYSDQRDFLLTRDFLFEEHCTDLLYIYFVAKNQEFHRCTYTKNEIIVESIHDDLRANNPEVKYLTSIPKIPNGISYKNIGEWEMFGRFAQWDQSIKLNELLED